MVLPLRYVLCVILLNTVLLHYKYMVLYLHHLVFRYYNINLFFLIHAYVAPVITPENFRYTNVAGTSITFEWDPLIGQGVNGIVRSYTVTCTPGSITVSSTSTKSNTIIVITNIIMYVKLSICNFQQVKTCG